MYCSKSLGFNTNIILFFPLPSFLRRVLYCCVKIWNKSKERHGIKTDHFNLLVRSSEDCWILYLLIKCYFQTVTRERGSIKKTRVTFNPSEHPMIYWDPPVTSSLSSVLTSFVQHVNQIAKPSGAHLLPRWIRYFEKYGCQDAFALMRNNLIAGFTTLVEVHFDWNFHPKNLKTTTCASVHSLQEVMGFH